MRPFFLFLFACIALAPASAWAQSTDPGDLFVSAYMAAQEGEKAEQSGKFKAAMSKLQFASKTLEQISERHPRWQPLMVEFRAKRTADAMMRVQEKVAKFGPGKSDPNDGPSDIIEPALPSTGNEPPLFFQPPGETAPPVTPSVAPRPRAPASSGGNPVREIEDTINKLTTELEKSREELARAQQEKEDLAKKLDVAAKARELAESKRQVLEERANNTEAALQKARVDGKKETESVKALRADLDAVKKQLRDLKIEGEAEADYRQQLNDRLKSAHNKVSELSQERDSAVKASSDVPGKIATIQKELQTAKKERDDLQAKLARTQTQLTEMTSQRDEALQQVGKMREAQKQVDKLIADNASLMAKLGDAEKTILQFKTEGVKKDEEIAALKKEVGSVKDQLAKAQTQSREYQTQMADLQQKLENTNAQLAQAKTENAASVAERKKMQDENMVLRGIVLRQQKEQARRDQTKKLVLEQLAKLEIDSKTLLNQIDYLGQPVVKLTAKERALFKKPELLISDTEIAMAAPKQEPEQVEQPVDGQTNGGEALPVEVPKPAPAPTPETKPAPTESAPPPPVAEPQAPVIALEGTKSVMDLANPPPAIEAPPVTMAKATPPPDDLPTKTPEAAPTFGNTPGTSATEAVPPGGNAPNVPPELLPLAREGKEQFERGNYREAEKIYERILSKAPSNLYTLSNLGVVRFRAGKLKLAEEAFKKAIAIAPEDAFSHCTLGIVYYSQGKYDEAVTELTKALAINNKNATAHNYLGITASQKGWQEAAQKELEAATSLDPAYADAHFNLAVVFATQQPPNKENARKYYKRATELGAEPDSALEQLIK